MGNFPGIKGRSRFFEIRQQHSVGSLCLMKNLPNHSIPTTHRRDYGDLGARGYGRRQSARIPDIFVTDKDVYMLPNLALLVYDSIADSRTSGPQCRQGIAQSFARRFEFD
jgi:hypothetical protein